MAPRVSRRDVFRTGAAAGAAATLGSLGAAQAAAAPPGPHGGPVPEDDIKQTSSVLTVVGGEIVHDTGEIST